RKTATGRRAVCGPPEIAFIPLAAGKTTMTDASEVPLSMPWYGELPDAGSGEEAATPRPAIAEAISTVGISGLVRFIIASSFDYVFPGNPITSRPAHSGSGRLSGHSANRRR